MTLTGSPDPAKGTFWLLTGFHFKKKVLYTEKHDQKCKIQNQS